MDSESLQEDGSNTKTTKQRPADKTKTKAGRTKKAGAAEGGGGGGGKKTAAQVGVIKLVSSDLVLHVL